MEKYKAYADEAMQLAEQSPTEDDRKFWLNIARAWLALRDMLSADSSCGPRRFGLSLGGRTQTER